MVKSIAITLAATLTSACATGVCPPGRGVEVLKIARYRMVQTAESVRSVTVWSDRIINVTDFRDGYGCARLTKRDYAELMKTVPALDEVGDSRTSEDGPSIYVGHPPGDSAWSEWGFQTTPPTAKPFVEPLDRTLALYFPRLYRRDSSPGRRLTSALHRARSRSVLCPESLTIARAASRR